MLSEGPAISKIGWKIMQNFSPAWMLFMIQAIKKKKQFNKVVLFFSLLIS